MQHATITSSEKPTLRECFNRIKPIMASVSEKMIFGQCPHVMFRDAMKRLSNMLEVAGTTGDIKCEKEIAELMASMFATAQETIYN
jgi:monomeric isocitrate dehydrogenase